MPEIPRFERSPSRELGAKLRTQQALHDSAPATNPKVTAEQWAELKALEDREQAERWQKARNTAHSTTAPSTASASASAPSTPTPTALAAIPPPAAQPLGLPVPARADRAEQSAEDLALARAKWAIDKAAQQLAASSYIAPEQWRYQVPVIGAGNRPLSVAELYSLAYAMSIEYDPDSGIFTPEPKWLFGEWVFSLGGNRVRAAHLALALATDEPIPKKVHYRDRNDGRDGQSPNLRLANIRAARVSAPSTGIYPHGSGYKVQISPRGWGKGLYVGLAKTVDEAQAMKARAELRWDAHLKEFGMPNDATTALTILREPAKRLS